MLDSILSYIQGIFDSITDFVEWLGLLFIEVFKALFVMLTDVVIWSFENLFTLVAGLIQGVSTTFDVVGLSSRVASLWSAVPPEMQGILSAIGLSSALSIVAVGILIRIGLQLIPFVRLGS